MAISLVGAACGGSDAASSTETPLTTVATSTESSESTDAPAPLTLPSTVAAEESVPEPETTESAPEVTEVVADSVPATDPPPDSAPDEPPATAVAPPPGDSGSPTPAVVEAFITSTGCEINPDIGRGEILITFLSGAFAGEGEPPAELIVADQSFSCRLEDVGQFVALSTQSAADALDVATWVAASSDPDWCAPIATAGTWVFVNLGRFGEDIVFDYMLDTVLEFDGDYVLDCLP